MVRSEPTADVSLAAIRERSRLGMAMAAMIRMIATTISNSISEKPFCLRMLLLSLCLQVRFAMGILATQTLENCCASIVAMVPLLYRAFNMPILQFRPPIFVIYSNLHITNDLL